MVPTVLAKRYCAQYVDGTVECFRDRDGFWYSDVGPPLPWYHHMRTIANGSAGRRHSQMGDTRRLLLHLHGVVPRRLPTRKVPHEEGQTATSLPPRMFHCHLLLSPLQC